MLNAIIKSALHQRPLVLAIALLLLIWGGITATRMDVDVFPDLTAPTVVVMGDMNETFARIDRSSVHPAPHPGRLMSRLANAGFIEACVRRQLYCRRRGQ